MLQENIYGKEKSLADLVQIKVNVTREDWVRLHSLKILRGVSIQDAVHHAIQKYFESMQKV